MDIYDLATGQWSTTTLSQPIDGPLALTLGQTGIFAGGEAGSGVNSNVDYFTNTQPVAPILSGSIAHPHRGSVPITVSNFGTAPMAAPYKVAVYASTSRTFGSGAGAVLLGDVNVRQSLSVATTAQIRASLSIPQGMPAGQYHLIATIGSAHQRVQIGSTRWTFTVGSQDRVARPSAKNAAGVFNADLPISQLRGMATTDNSATGGYGILDNDDKTKVLG